MKKMTKLLTAAVAGILGAAFAQGPVSADNTTGTPAPKAAPSASASGRRSRPQNGSLRAHFGNQTEGALVRNHLGELSGNVGRLGRSPVGDSRRDQKRLSGGNARRFALDWIRRSARQKLFIET